MKWRSRLSQAKAPSEQELKLAHAYREVFGKRSEAVEMVLADFAAFTGFYNVAPPGTSGDALQYDAGMRAAFARIFNFISLSDEQMQALEKAARAESEQFNP